MPWRPSSIWRIWHSAESWWDLDTGARLSRSKPWPVCDMEQVTRILCIRVFSSINGNSNSSCSWVAMQIKWANICKHHRAWNIIRMVSVFVNNNKNTHLNYFKHCSGPWQLDPSLNFQIAPSKKFRWRSVDTQIRTQLSPNQGRKENHLSRDTTGLHSMSGRLFGPEK